MTSAPEDLNPFLEASDVVDFNHERIQALLDASGWRELGELERVRSAFEFVRDEIRHSWDAQDPIVTCRASDVLHHQTGLCYAKSHLLAALLRGVGVPCGFCYQRLVLFDDPADGYSLHGFNAAYLASLNRWVRFDARGNKPGIEAEFSLERERLAFRTREEMGEVDYPEIFAEPAAYVVEKLQVHRDAKDLYRHGLPDGPPSNSSTWAVR